jgi:hypothetical protein
VSAIYREIVQTISATLATVDGPATENGTVFATNLEKNRKTLSEKFSPLKTQAREGN